MNIINVYLLYGTSFHTQYAYQFIIAYTISGWFFRDKRNWLIHTLVINAMLVVATIVVGTSAKATFDFYATYLIALLAQVILIHFRFSIEEKLIESEKKYRLVTENSFDLICIHDSKAKLEFVSPSIKRLLGYDQEELVGQYPITIVHPEDANVMKGIDFRKNGQPKIFRPAQFRLKSKDGDYIWFETIFTMMDGSDGLSNVVLSQSRDIRRSKKYQQQLEERSRELERSNADLETFAFVSSHDMQEPLRMISNYMQLLKKRYEGRLDEQADEYIEFANRGAITLQQLLRDLLAFSRITRSELKSDIVNAKNLLNEVVKNIELDLKERNATVVSEELCTGTTDRQLLMLVFQNLVQNGVKYNKSERPEVKVSCAKGEKEVVFCFADNGIGIKPDHQQRIFEPFHRLHTKYEYPGTGLGLSICKKIIERLGGRMWVESELGAGSKFYFSLPVR
jgi:PAS domain S-box-containing protein